MIINVVASLIRKDNKLLSFINEDDSSVFEEMQELHEEDEQFEEIVFWLFKRRTVY